MTTPSPAPLPSDPPPIDRRHELLSAMVDGELSGEELGELEQLAVDEGTTLEEMAGDYQHIHEALRSSVGVFRAPPGLRDRHLSVALEAAGEPGVASLAAARVNRRPSRPVGGLRPWPWLSGVAAALVVVAGIGLATTLGGGDDSEQAGTPSGIDDTAEESSQIVPTEPSSATSEELRAEAASDDASAGDAFDAAGESSLAAGSAPVIVEGVAPAELASVVEFERAGAQDLDTPPEAESTTGLACLAEASSLGTLDGFAVVLLDEQVYEVFRADTGLTAVYDQRNCTRVD